MLIYLSENNIPIIKPEKKDVWRYVETILKKKMSDVSGKSYLPLITLPKKEEECAEVLEHLYQLNSVNKIICNNEDAYKYLISEMVDNIYQHSEFNLACVMAQNYPYKGYNDIVFLDNGITIPGSFMNYGFLYKKKNQYQAIIDALNGLSTKDDPQRGYGLSSSTKIFLELGGEIFIVSGYGAIYLSKTKNINFNLQKHNMLDGTLVSIRVKDTDEKIDIYQFLEQ